ncbi:MAG: 2-phosphosulfolactate phosphatase [Cytophagaceae bacterium]|nr:2-phosphosulfolactate phosphatase [Cytophagaceae bacterium]MDW8457029.1 2-phosphosulfolactate phosphatase [Cytophagaceae bacterium]
MREVKTIEVCTSPELVPFYGVEGKVVVVVDILRATSCMTTALAFGMKSIIPVATIEECRAYKEKGYLAAAERDGKTVEGFDFGNSPYTYMDSSFKGKKLAVTTTNGTLAITKSKNAHKVIIGSFLNLSSVTNYLMQQDRDVLIVCSGWKGKLNLEDTVFAGAIIDIVKDTFNTDNDSAIAAYALYDLVRKDIKGFLKKASHVKRLKGLNIKRDIIYCLQVDLYNVLPELQGDELVAMPTQTTHNTILRKVASGV